MTTIDRIDRIKERARELGACGLVDGVASWEDACGLLFTAQGREFASRHGFPTPDMFGAAGDSLSAYGVYTDFCGEIPQGTHDVAIAGNSDATVYCSGCDRVYKVMLFHGAKARINATNYAVVTVTRVGECGCEVTDDGTAKIIME